MTPLTDKLLAVPVREDATGFFINNVGCIRYSTDNGRLSSCIEPQEMGVYIEKEKYSILGLCSPKEIGFDPAKYIECISANLSLYKNYDAGSVYMEHQCNSATDSFRSLLQSKGLDINQNYLIISKI